MAAFDRWSSIDWPNDPVYKDEQDRWWFWDETWGDRCGPYKTREEAEAMLATYMHVVLGEDVR